MNDKQTLKAALDTVHAPQDWKEGVFARMERETTKKLKHPRRHGAVTAVIACLICLVFGGCAYFCMPVSYLSIDINPSLQLGINRLDRVVTVTGYNPEGKELASSLHLFFLPYADALEEIMNAKDTLQYLKKDLPITIAVEGNSKEKGAQMLETVSHYADSHHGNVSCHHAESGLAQEARELGISLGKYQVYLELKALDPAITPQEAQALTMRELWERIAALSPNENSASGSASPTEESTPASSSSVASEPYANETHDEHETDGGQQNHGQGHHGKS